MGIILIIIISGFTVFIVQGALIVALSIQRKRLKQKEQKLRDSAMRYRMFMDHSLEGIWCVEFDEPIDLTLPEEEQFELVYKHGYMAEANDAYAKHVGFERGEELVGTKLEKFCSRSIPENVATIKSWIRGRYTINNVETVESYQDGVTRTILNNAIGIIESGSVVRVWGTESDITERKQAEQALSQSKNFNKAILNTIEDHIVVTDRSGCILTVNESWIRFARDNDADLSLIGPGVNYFDVCQRAVCGLPHAKTEQNNINAALKGLNAVLNGDTNRFTLEYPCHLPTEKHWFQMVVLPFTGDKGGLVVAHRDITAIKKTEEKLVDAERKYRTVADFTYDWEYWEALDGSLIYVSPACERVTGYCVSELMERPDLISTLVTPEDRSIWQDHSHGLQTGSKSGPSHCHFRIRNRDGDIRWIAHVCQPVYNEQGDYAGVRASNRDITELRMAEQKLYEHREILAQVDRRETLGLLAGAIAHELNQPLTGILSDAQAGELLLEQEAADSVQIRDILTDIVTDTKRASQIIRNLRKLFDGRHVDYSPFQVDELVGETLRILNSEIIDRGLIVEKELHKNLPMVNGDSVLVQQVLINLIKNSWEAVQHNERADRRIKINTASEEDGHVVICVEDNGPGIDSDQIRSIFNPLKSNKKGGLGMGLAICQSIVKTHGGRIWVENRTNGGTRFIFTLPILEVIS